MKRVKLTSKVWGFKPGKELDLDGERLALVIRKGYGEVIERKPRKAPKNKAVGNAKKNK